MANRTFVTLTEYAELERAAHAYGVRFRYLAHTAVEYWVEDSSHDITPFDREPDEPIIEVSALLPWQLYQSLKDISMNAGSHMRVGFRNALLYWLALERAHIAPIPTADGNAEWESHWWRRWMVERNEAP